MAILNVLSEQKGSNPGGRCHFNSDRHDFNGYFKYCYGSRIKGHSSFVPEHQPIYEIMTFELARLLGLNTVDAFLLLNQDRNLRFDESRFKNNHTHAGREFYFISKWENHPLASALNFDEIQIIENEGAYLDSLLIKDIIGKRQNYAICEHNPGRAIYIDLGCSFVHAVGGYLLQPNKLKVKDFDKKPRKIRKYLISCHIIGVDNKTIINLGELAEKAESLPVSTLNPFGRVSIDKLLSEDEINEISSHLVYSLLQAVPTFKEKGLILY